MNQQLLTNKNPVYSFIFLEPVEATAIKMIDNYVAHLLSHIEVKKQNINIDEIEYPGIASTIKGCSVYPGLHTYNGKEGILNEDITTCLKINKYYSKVRQHNLFIL